MHRAAKVAQSDVAPWGPRIRALIEEDKVGAARRLLAQALRESATDPELATLRKVLAPAHAKPNSVQDPDRSAELRWLQEHGESYKGRWVALLGADLLAHAETLDELLSRLRERAPQASAFLHYVG